MALKMVKYGTCTVWRTRTIIKDKNGIPDFMTLFFMDPRDGKPDEKDVPDMFKVNGKIVQGVAISQFHTLPYNMPIENKTFTQAEEMCKKKGPGWHLLTNTEFVYLLNEAEKMGKTIHGNEWQMKAYEKLLENGELTLPEVKQMKKQIEAESQCPGQMVLPEIQDEEPEQAAEEQEEEQEEETEETPEQEAEPEEWEDPTPETVESLCYSCDKYEVCHEKKATVTKCNAYVNRKEARLTEEQVELDEDKQEELNEKLQTLIAYATKHPTVSVTYFKPDDKKTGGEYVTATGIFQKFRDYERTIVLEDGTDIECDRIVEIRGI